MVDYLFLLNISIFLIFMKYMRVKGPSYEPKDIIKQYPNRAYIFLFGLYLAMCGNISNALGTACLMAGKPLSDSAFYTIITVLFLVVYIPSSAMVLRAKNRSLWWLLLANWGSSLWLRNKSIKE